MPLPEPTVVNALLRCTRKDRDARAIFECVRADLDLWVWELGPLTGLSGWNAWLDATSRLLRENLTFLTGLKSGSDDYTLHIALTFPGDPSLLRLPHDFLGIAHEAGFEIEISNS